MGRRGRELLGIALSGALLSVLLNGGACATAASGSAQTSPPLTAADLEGCAPWVLHPERAQKVNFLVGVGSAPQESPDALAKARKGALSDIAQQIRVRVKSTEASELQSASANGAESQSQYLQSTVKTSADEEIEGASQLDSCQGRGRLYVLMWVSRHRLIQGSLERLQKISKDGAALEARAEALLLEHRNSEAADLYKQCAKLAAAAEPLANFVRIVGQEDPDGSLRAPEEYERLAHEAVGRARIVVPELVADDGVTLKVAHTLTEELLTQVNRFAGNRQVLSPADIEGLLGYAAAAKKIGANDEAGLGRLGAALAADELVTGTLALIGSTYLVTLKRFDARKLSIVRQQSRKIATQAPDALLAVVDDLAARLFPEEAIRLAATSGGDCGGLCLELDFKRPGGALCPGDKTQANLLSDRPGYVVVFDVFGPDQAMVIFPNASNPEGRVAAGQKISLFEGGFTAVPFPGGREETLVAFRADRPDQLGHAAPGRWSGPCRVSERLAKLLHDGPRQSLGNGPAFTEDGYQFLDSGDADCAAVAPPPAIAEALAAVPRCE